MQTRSSDENSVRLSVKRVYCDKTEERSVQIFIPYERPFSLVFLKEEWLVGGDPFYLKFWVRAKSPIFSRYSLDSASAVTPSKKVQLTLIGSPLRAF